MSANGGIIGPDNVPTSSVSSGVWSLAEAYDAQTTGDPYWDNVSLLINCDGGSITDVSQHTATVGTSGDPTASTTSPKFGSHSINLDGNDHLTNPTSSNLNIQSGDWTIEYWMRFPSGASWSTSGQLVFGQGINTSDFWHISNHWSTTSDIYFAVRDGGSTWSTSVVSSSGAVDQSSTAWHHYAFSNASNTLKIFKNGTEIGSGTFTGNADIANNFFIGAGYGTGGIFTAAQNHYIDDFRLTKGVARYTSNFIVPDATFQTGNPSWPVAPYDIESIVVAAGGAGGNGGTHGAAGGGAGGYRSSVSSESSGGGASVEAVLSVVVGTGYTVTIGAGGAGTASTNTNGGSGNNSVLGTVTSIGGGGGGRYLAGSAGTAPSGGSGGGGGSYAGSGGSGTSSQGYAGGDAGGGDTNYPGGGGGGAGAVGATPASATAKGGAGGVGVQSNVDGNNHFYAGGGGGGGYVSGNGGGNGGLGGGGGGSTKTGAAGTGGGSARNSGIAGSAGASGANAGAGGANTGGGAGAGDTTHSGASGNGGSGIVILRYPGSQKGSGGTITSSGGYTVHTFTSSGTYTA